MRRFRKTCVTLSLERCSEAVRESIFGSRTDLVFLFGLVCQWLANNVDNLGRTRTLADAFHAQDPEE